MGEAKLKLGWVGVGLVWLEMAAGHAAPAGQTRLRWLGASADVFSRHKSLSFGIFAVSCVVCGVLVDGGESVGQVWWGLEREEVLVIIFVGRWREGVLSMVEHVASVIGSEVASLCPEVQEDGIGFPAAKRSNGSFIHP